MLTLKPHRSAIQGGQPLQTLTGYMVTVALAATIRMQHQHAASVSLLEFGQLAIGLYTQNPVQVEKIGITGQGHIPFKFLSATSRWSRVAVTPGSAISRWCRIESLTWYHHAPRTYRRYQPD